MASHTKLASALLELIRAHAEYDSMSAGMRHIDVSTPFSTTSQSDWVEGVRYWNERGRHLIADLPERYCPVCEHGDFRHLFQSYDGWPYVECLSCGCWYVPLKVEAELFEHFFELCPEAFDVLERVFRGRQSEASQQSNVERVLAYLDAVVPMLEGRGSLNYLDMGCGLGHSLQAAQAHGLRAVGVESSRECIAQAREKGLNVFHVSDASWQRQQFHLISFWESLEHMVDPVAVLTQSAKRLSKNGLLAFTVPNQNSPLVRTQREDCSFVHGGYDTPGHINLFDPATLNRLFDRSGYTLLALDGQYSLSLIELVSYLIGKQRGTHDLLLGQTINSELSAKVDETLRAIGPAFALLERVTLIAPIIFGFACRKEDSEHFAHMVSAFRSQRHEKLIAQIRELEPDVISVAALQQQYQDAMAALQQQYQDAMDKIEHLEDQLQLAHNPLRRLVRFVLRKPNSSQG